MFFMKNFVLHLIHDLNILLLLLDQSLQYFLEYIHLRIQHHCLRMAPLPHILIEIDWFYNIISGIRFQLKLTIFDNSIIIINQDCICYNCRRQKLVL